MLQIYLAAVSEGQNSTDLEEKTALRTEVVSSSEDFFIKNTITAA